MSKKKKRYMSRDSFVRIHYLFHDIMADSDPKRRAERSVDWMKWNWPEEKVAEYIGHWRKEFPKEFSRLSKECAAKHGGSHE